MLDYLPILFRLPVILDFVAPRPLESLFEMPDGIQQELFRLRKFLKVLGQRHDRPELVAEASANASRLAQHDLYINNTITALNSYLAKPVKSHALAALPVATAAALSVSSQVKT